MDAVAYHHRPIRHAGQAFSPLTAVHVADHLQTELDATEPESVQREQLDWAYLERLGLTERLGVWRDLARHRG